MSTSKVASAAASKAESISVCAGAKWAASGSMVRDERRIGGEHSRRPEVELVGVQRKRWIGKGIWSCGEVSLRAARDDF